MKSATLFLTKLNGKHVAILARRIAPVELPSLNPTPDPDPMQLAFSSNAYLHFSIEETIARIAALGYRGIELLADVPHAWPAGLLASAEAGDPRRARRSTAWRSPTSTPS